MKALSYTLVLPSRTGMYWYLEDRESQPKILRVYQDSMGYWSVQYDALQYSPNGYMEEDDDDIIGTDFLENYHGFWAGPILPPKEPKIDIEEEKED